MGPPCHCQGLVIHSGVQILSCTNTMPCSESSLFQLLPFLLLFFIYSENINCASLFCALCKNSKINKTLEFKAFSVERHHFHGNYFFLLSFIFNLFTIYISLYYSELSSPWYHKAAILTALNLYFLIQVQVTQMPHRHLPHPPSSGANQVAAESVTFLPSFLVMSSSWLSWLLESSCSIQLAFSVRLPCSLSCLLHNGRDYLIPWIWVEQDEVPSWESLSS